MPNSFIYWLVAIVAISVGCKTRNENKLNATIGVSGTGAKPYTNTMEIMEADSKYYEYCAMVDAPLQSSETPVNNADLDKMLQRIGGDTFADRETATRELQSYLNYNRNPKYAAEAVRQLRRDLASYSLEVQERISKFLKICHIESCKMFTTNVVPDSKLRLASGRNFQRQGSQTGKGIITISVRSIKPVVPVEEATCTGALAAVKESYIQEAQRLTYFDKLFRPLIARDKVQFSEGALFQFQGLKDANNCCSVEPTKQTFRYGQSPALVLTYKSGYQGDVDQFNKGFAAEVCSAVGGFLKQIVKDQNISILFEYDYGDDTFAPVTGGCRYFINSDAVEYYRSLPV